MGKDFRQSSYICDDNIADTLQWLLQHQDCFESFEYDCISQRLLVHHANGTDDIRPGQYLNAAYGLLITSL